MPVEFLANTQADYADALTLGAMGRSGQQFSSVLFAVSAPNSAKFQVAKKRLDGTIYWDGNDITAQPGQGGYEKCYGIRFKSFDSGNPTTVLCIAFFADDPVPSGNLASSAEFSTSGSVTPGGGGTTIKRVTALPTGPSDGQIVSLVPDSVSFPGVEWLLIYKTSSGYWDFIGGSNLYVEGSGSFSLSTSYADLGVSLVVPLVGIYDVTHGAEIFANATRAGFLAPNGAGLSASDSIAATVDMTAGGTSAIAYVAANVFRYLARQSLSAGTINLQGKRVGAGPSISNAWLSVLPVRIPG